MKLERINAAAQTELPNASPLNLSQRVSNMSAPIPDKKRMEERIPMRRLALRLGDDLARSQSRTFIAELPGASLLAGRMKSKIALQFFPEPIDEPVSLD